MSNFPSTLPPSDYQLLKEVADSVNNLPDEPIGPLQDAFGTFLALWIECLEADNTPAGFEAGLAILSRADVERAASMRWAMQESMSILPE